MSNITYQIIPFAFLFVILLFFLSLKKGNNLKNKNFTNTVEINKYDFFKFLESTEKIEEYSRKKLIQKGMLNNLICGCDFLGPFSGDPE